MTPLEQIALISHIMADLVVVAGIAPGILFLWRKMHKVELQTNGINQVISQAKDLQRVAEVVIARTEGREDGRRAEVERASNEKADS